MALADIPAVYVIGAPRSGTTWLQRMLGGHPQIATPFELDFFSRFVAPWYESWRIHCEAGEGRPNRPYWGVPAAVTEAEFEEAVGLVVERIYRSVLAAKPGATVLLEKDPKYSRCVDAILRTVPHARFIHVIRDGRDVACSTARVSRSWGGAWAPPDAAGAAKLWRKSVHGALTARTARGGYMEVRYEELLSGAGPTVLRAALSFCGVGEDPALAAELYDRYRYPGRGKQEVLSGGLVWTGEAVRAGAKTRFPDDFIGPAAAGGWQNEFGARDRQAFDAFAGDLLIELGYERDHSWAHRRPRSWLPVLARGKTPPWRRSPLRAERDRV
jgi:Sulfotransferase family